MAKTIMIVEDEQYLSDAYKIILQKEGYTTLTAYDGEQALEAAQKQAIDLILLDLRMPRMGGIEFLKAYNAPENHPTTKIIVFSNLDTDSEINEAYQLGAHKYMLKAWASPKELVGIVADILKD